jgi:hypothetical protein
VGDADGTGVGVFVGSEVCNDVGINVGEGEVDGRGFGKPLCNNDGVALGSIEGSADGIGLGFAFE